MDASHCTRTTAAHRPARELGLLLEQGPDCKPKKDKRYDIPKEANFQESQPQIT